MPKAGNYDYPYLDIDPTVQKLVKLHDVAKTLEMTRSIAAQSLGMAESSGYFAYVISSFEKYGFVDIGGGNVSITRLGKSAIFGTPDEIEKAKQEAVSNVGLFRDIAGQYGQSPTIEQIKVFLRQKAHVDISEADKIAKNVLRMYKNVARYIIPTTQLEQPPSKPVSKVAGESRGEFTVNEPVGTELLKIQFKDTYIQLPDNLENIDRVISTLEAIKAGHKKSEIKPETKEQSRNNQGTNKENK
jgi:hypothetical protein